MLAWALVVGVVLSSAQIWIDARAQSDELDRTAHQALDALREAAVNAVYEIDNGLAAQVLNGLSAYPGVYKAELFMRPDVVLARRDGELIESKHRWITDKLFGPERAYVVPLADPRGGGEPLGELRFNVDTFVAGRAFIERTFVVAGIGFINAGMLGVILLIVVVRFLTQPLATLVASLTDAATETPESAAIAEPAGHSRDELGRLARALNRLLAAIRENLARRAEAEARASYLQQYDDLTGLPNRRLFMTRLGHAIATAATRGEPVAVLLFDLREFREFNKLYGAAVGDEVLRQTGKRLEPLAGGQALLARLGDDIFAVLLRDGVNHAGIEALAQRAHEELSRPVEIEQSEYVIAIRSGAAIYPDDAVGAEQLMQIAEAALKLAKRESDDATAAVHFYDTSRDDEALARKQLSIDLGRREMLDQLALVYEPQVSTRNGRVVGMEALVRWRHPTLGLLRPASFIRLAEESGAIHAIGDWVLRHAAAKVMSWRLALGESMTIAVNVSAAQLRRGHLDAQVARVLEALALPPESLEIEITETAIVDNIHSAAQILKRVRELGVGISIDDFGTGHASLGYLKQLPVTKLKIDMSFVRDVLTDASDATIVRAIIGLGHSLGLSVTAEGVETVGQQNFLEDLGCDALQGMLFGIGLDEDALLIRLRERGGPGRRLHAV